jgi:aryl-alcohol dehydrogenase-like predicted oxidoreductase
MNLFSRAERGMPYGSPFPYQPLWISRPQAIPPRNPSPQNHPHSPVTQLHQGSAFGENPVNNSGLSRKHLIEGTNAALSRLQLDYVDLLYCHRPDRNTPIEETVRAMNHLINTGKTLYWGTSEWNAEEIAMAWSIADRLGLIGPLMEQPGYSLLNRQKVEGEFQLLYETYGLGLTIFSPLKTGILTGKYNDGIPEGSRYKTASDPFSSGRANAYGDEQWTRDIELTKKLKPIAEKLGTDTTTLAYAWVVKNPRVTSAITGASKVEQVAQAVRSLALLEKLTPEVLKEIDETLGNKPAVLTRRFT